MLPEEEQGQNAPEINSSETKEVLEDLQKQGHEFEGVKSEPKPEPETPKEEPKDEPKEEVPEETKEEPKKEVIEPKEPVKREARELPAWKVKMAERRAKQEKKEEPQKESDKEITKDKSTTDEPEDVDKQIDELTDKLEKGEINTRQWAKEFRKLQPKAELPKDITERLDKLGETEQLIKRQKEDHEFSEAFDDSVAKAIKDEHPSASSEDLKAIKAKLKESYFNPKYITLSPLEIYTLQKSELSKEISPSDTSTMEDGKKGVGRQDKVIDYENLTEEDFAKLSPEEQEKVAQYKIDKDNEARGIKTS